MKRKRILILGAGPSGLGAAWRLKKLGFKQVTILERSDVAGGLARSFVDKAGFTWDIGGHVLFSHSRYFDRVFETVMGGEYFTHKRESWIWVAHRFVPYPFQNNIHRLPAALCDECIRELKEARKISKIPETFADWINISYGKGIARIFLLPYNRKVWAYPPDKLSWRWTGDRVAPVDITKIEENIRMNHDDIAWGPNAVFRFPKNGGTGEIWRRIANRVAEHITYNKNIIHIDARRKTVYCSDGSSYPYDILFSTAPLTNLVKMTGKTAVIPEVSGLSSSNVTVVGIGMKGNPKPHIASKCWIYFPDPEIPFFRATVFSNYSVHNVPAGHWSLMLDVASSLHRPVPKGDIVDFCIQSAKSATLIDQDAPIVDRFVFTASPAYPTPTLDRDDILTPAIVELARHDIYSKGRFGLWKYEIGNMDHVFMQGVEWAESIV